MKKLRKKIEEIEEIIKTLPGLKAQLKELEDGSSSSSSSSPGESKTEAPSFQFCDFSLPPTTAPTKDVSLGVEYFFFLSHVRGALSLAVVCMCVYTVCVCCALVCGVLTFLTFLGMLLLIMAAFLFSPALSLSLRFRFFYCFFSTMPPSTFFFKMNLR